MTATCRAFFLSSLVLVFTGVQRHASGTLDGQIEKTRARKIDRELSHLLALTKQAVDVLEGTEPEAMIKSFGAMMHEGWMTKRQLSGNISTPEIDALYDHALASGALGGKLCGAGGGGFLLMVVPPHNLARFEEMIRPAPLTRVGLDTSGSVILHG